MSYTRVLPRDLFNEANLLKCIAKLILLIEDKMINVITYHYDGEAFNIVQDPSDGSISIGNINIFKTGKNGGAIKIYRPLNSRNPWPLYALFKEEEFLIFYDNGDLTEEFKNAFLEKELING